MKEIYFEYLIKSSDGKLYVIVNKNTAEVRKLTFFEKLLLLFL